MAKDKLDNVAHLFSEDETKKQVDKVIQDAIEDTKELNIVNCMFIMIDDTDVITYSYANFNKCITMVGALETMKNIYVEDGKLNRGDSD